MEENILRLHGKVQHYAWGGNDFIPDLFGVEKVNDKPYAEFWMGAHPTASSSVILDNKLSSLQKLIQESPVKFLGEQVYKTFGELPYLLKVLDVKDMLSIQVHPTKDAAVRGFESEEAAGIALSAETRNYKDKNHKPEVAVALGDFWLLHGFKLEKELRKTLTSVPEFSFLLPVFDKDGYFGLYKLVMEMPQQQVNNVLSPLVEKSLSAPRQFKKTEPGYWVNKLYQGKVHYDNIDRGIFSIYFFNIMQLNNGDAVFQGAGIPHAYLEGQNVELMANSDNVLRGGLTPKNIDVTELLKNIRFEGTNPQILSPNKISDIEKNYPCPVADFGISMIELTPNQKYRSHTSSGEIYLVVQGSISIDHWEKTFETGSAFYVLPETDVSFFAGENSLVFKAFVPGN